MDDGSKPLNNRKHERFALLLAQGEVSAAEAYRREIAEKGAGERSIEANSSRLANSDEVKLRVGWLKNEVEAKARKIAGQTVLTMLEKRLFIARVVRAAPSEASMDNPDCELVMTKMGPCPLFPSKAALIKLDNDLAGDGSEAQGMSALGQLLAQIRK